MSAPRAVLWDMDGTLIDSEEFHWISWREAMADEGVAITHEQFLSSFGQRNDSIIPRWLGAALPPERIARIGNVKEELYRDLVRKNGISPLPGVASWVHWLHEHGWLQANRFGGTACERGGCARGSGGCPLFSGHRLG